jgi:hypothetical protein
MVHAEQKHDFSNGLTVYQQALEEAFNMAEFEQLAQQAADSQRAGQSTQEVFTYLGATARACPSEAELSASIAHLLSADRLAGQFAIAACRTVFSVCESAPGMSVLLLGLPCVVRHWPKRVASKVPAEIQGWLRSQWLSAEDTDAQVVVAPSPIPVEAVEDVVGPELLQWAQTLVDKGTAPAAWLDMNEAPFVAALWMVAIRVPTRTVDALRRRLQAPAAMDTMTSMFLHRMDALAEEEGALMKLLPPASWTNVFSRARALAFRQQAQALARSVAAGTALEMHYDGVQLDTHTPSGKVLSWGAYPEETREDIEEMLAHVEEMTGLQLSLVFTH